MTVMAELTMVEAQSVAELAKSLYDYLPGTFSSITWPDVAARFCLENYWQGGSKLPAITQLFRNTLQHHRDRFCDFIVAVVQEGIDYRIKKDNPIRRDEIEAINKILLKVQFKIPELHDEAFLSGLANTEEELSGRAESKPMQVFVKSEVIDSLHKKFLELFGEVDKQKRGYAFEKFLDELFHAHGLSPQGSFRIVGEQIDGSFEWQGDTYLVEARWRKQKANSSDLLVLRGKCEKSDWTRGLFISINGFSDLVSDTHRIGRKANLIAMSGDDLILILEKRWTLGETLQAKLRHTGETGEVYFPLDKAIRHIVSEREAAVAVDPHSSNVGIESMGMVLSDMPVFSQEAQEAMQRVMACVNKIHKRWRTSRAIAPENADSIAALAREAKEAFSKEFEVITGSDDPTQFPTEFIEILRETREQFASIEIQLPVLRNVGGGLKSCWNQGIDALADVLKNEFLKKTIITSKSRSKDIPIKKHADIPMRLCIEFDEVTHFDKKNQIVSFSVVNDGKSRVQQVHAFIKEIIPLEKKTHPEQLATEFTDHELSPMREPERKGDRLDSKQSRLIKFVWTTPSDKHFYFSGYDINGNYRKEGFRTLKIRCEISVVVTCRNATPGTATFRIGRTNDGRMTIKRLDTHVAKPKP